MTDRPHITLIDREQPVLLAWLTPGNPGGDPFEGLPTGGLLELVRDLINFAYRDHIVEAPRSEFLATVMSTTDFTGATK